MPPGYLFRQMDDADANRVAGWRYEPPYDFYDSDADPEDLAELLDPQSREGVYFSVLDRRGDLVGFFQFEKGDETVDVGLGLRPDLTGGGIGMGFCPAGLEFARGRFAPRRFAPRRFTLSVAAPNERAIRVYERVGFRRGEGFAQRTNGGEYPFLSMGREA